MDCDQIMEAEPFSIVCDLDGARLDSFLSEKMDGLSRTRVQSLISEGYVSVSGKVRKPGYKLAAGDVIEGALPPSEPLRAVPVNLPLDVVYEDKHIIVINKPKNMVVHPAPGHFNDTLVNALLFHCAGGLSGINGVLRPGIIHRIDKNTTGLLIAAKTNEAHIALSEQLRARKIERVYEAIVFGVVKDDFGTVDAPIGRDEKNRLRMSVNRKNGKPAVTRYKVVERLDGYTHIEARLETGRTHQIRVHMAHIGYPVLGDTLYTGRKQPFKLEGQTLHAGALSFFHPETNRLLELVCPLPEYFVAALEKIRGLRR